MRDGLKLGLIFDKVIIGSVVHILLFTLNTFCHVAALPPKVYCRYACKFFFRYLDVFLSLIALTTSRVCIRSRLHNFVNNKYTLSILELPKLHIFIHLHIDDKMVLLLHCFLTIIIADSAWGQGLHVYGSVPGRIFSNTIKLMLERQKFALYQHEMLLESTKITLDQQDIPHYQDMLL